MKAAAARGKHLGRNQRGAQGEKGGRPAARSKGPGKSKLDSYRPEIEALLANGSTQKFIAKHYGAMPANLSNRLRKKGIRKPRL